MSIPNWLNYLGFTKYDLTQLTRVFSKSVLFLLLSPCYRVKNCWVNQSDLRWHDNFSGRCRLPHPTKKHTPPLYRKALVWKVSPGPCDISVDDYGIPQTGERRTLLNPPDLFTANMHSMKFRWCPMIFHWFRRTAFADEVTTPISGNSSNYYSVYLIAGEVLFIISHKIHDIHVWKTLYIYIPRFTWLP